MSDSDFAVNLLESNTFTRSVTVLIPQENGAERELKLDATYEAIEQKEWEEFNGTKSEAVELVLRKLKGIPGCTHKGVEYTPEQVGCKNPFTCDALFMDYTLAITKNGRDAAKGAAEGNSKRSRRR